MRESVIEREQRVCARYGNKRNEQPALAFSGNELVPHLFQRQHVIAMHQAAPPPSVSTLIHSMRMHMREHTYAYEERHRNAPSCSASFSQYTSKYLAVNWYICSDAPVNKALPSAVSAPRRAANHACYTTIRPLYCPVWHLHL
jgi:hypothetical protein